MTLFSFRLMEAHQRVDEALRSEARRRWPDVARVLKLKRLKLAIRGRLARLAPRLEYAA
jgi:hypothetical protein